MKNRQSEILARAYKKLKKANSSVSIRSLANASTSKISHVYLGKLIRGEVKLAIDRFESISRLFKLDELDRANLKGAMANDRIGKLLAEPQATSSSELTDFVDLPENHFKHFSHWWSFAALDLLTCELPLTLNVEALASILGVPINQISGLIKMLKSIGVVDDKNGRLTKTHLKLRIPARTPNRFSRMLYTEIAELTKKELARREQSDYDARQIIGYSCAVNPARLPEAKARLAKAVKECAEFLADGPCTEVYWVQGQMFSLLK